MRFLSWFTGLLFALGLLVTTALVLISDPCVRPWGDGKAEAVSRRPADGVQDGIRTAFELSRELLRKERDEVATRIREALRTGIESLLREGTAEDGDRQRLAKTLPARLVRARKAQDLDLLFAVTAEDEVFVAGAERVGSPGASGTGVPDFAHLLARMSRDPELLAVTLRWAAADPGGAEAYPAEAEAEAEAEAGADEAAASDAAEETDLFLIATVPVAPVGAEPTAVLVGGRSVRRIAADLDSRLTTAGAEARWQAFLRDPAGGGEVVAGTIEGSPVRPEFVRVLERDAVTDEPALESPSAPQGRWAVARSPDGRPVGGWGVTAASSAATRGPVGRSAKSATAASPTLGAIPRGTGPESLVIVAGATASLGLLTAVFVAGGGLARRRPRREREGRDRTAGRPGAAISDGAPELPPPTAPEDGRAEDDPDTPRRKAPPLPTDDLPGGLEAPPAPDVAQTRAAEEILLQFETSWRTFATYTQDLLHRKLKEYERGREAQGGREIQDRLERLAGALGDLRAELSLTTSEVRGLSREVLVRAAASPTGTDESTTRKTPEPGDEKARDDGRGAPIGAEVTPGGEVPPDANGMAETEVARDAEVPPDTLVTPDAEIPPVAEVTPGGEVMAGSEGVMAGSEGTPATEDTPEKEGTPSTGSTGSTEDTDGTGVAPGGEVILRRVESDIEHAGDLVLRLVALVRRGGGEDPAALERELSAHLDSLLAEVREARRRSEALVDALRRSREAEASLELDLAEAASREEALRRDLEDSNSKRAESFIEEGRSVQRERDLTLELRIAEERLQTTEEGLQSAEERLARAEEEKAAREVELEAEREARRVLEADGRTAIEAAHGTIEELESDREALESRRAQLALDLTSARDELGALRAEIDGLRAGRKERLHELHEESRRLATELEAARSGAAGSLAAARGRITELERELARVSLQIGERDQAISRLVAELTQTAGTLRERDERISALGAEVARLTTDLHGEEERVVALSTELGEVRDRLEHAAAELAAKATARPERGAGPPAEEAAGDDGDADDGDVHDTDVDGGTALDARALTAFSGGLMRSLPVALIVLDRGGRVVSWNRLAEDLFGITEETALGKDLFSLETPLAKTAFRTRYEHNRDEKATHRIRVRMEVQGIAGYYILTQAPFRGEDGRQLGAILTLQPA